jgi:aspartyl-tRNA(Asn)/glutamyl-tRNA(Gln) amidotransferase subunit B
MSVRVDPAWREQILARLPELPLARYERFIAQYHLTPYDATILTEERSLSDYFEEAVRLFGGEPKSIANWVQNEVLRLLKENNLAARELPFSPAHLAELARLVEDKTITRQTAVAVIPKVIASGQTPTEIVAAEGLAQISGDEALRELARQVVAENPKEVEAYRAKPSLLKWFVGQVMRKSKGQANAQVAEKLLKDILEA